MSHFKEIIQNKYSFFLQIYTDASKSQYGTGLAIIREEIKILHKLPPESSIFTAENYAILEAIKSTNLITSNNNILIVSDSLSALLALQNPSSTNEITQNIQTELNSTKKNIVLMWVPSHIGIAGNEMADKSADEATKTILHPTITDIPANDINLSIINNIKTTWQSYWDSVPPSNKLKKIKKCTKKWHQSHNLNRRREVSLARVRIGHSFLTHSFLISKDPPPTCNKCQETLTMQHIILDCPDLQNIRNKLSIPNNLEEALHEDNTIKILNFLTQINIVNNL